MSEHSTHSQAQPFACSPISTDEYSYLPRNATEPESPITDTGTNVKGHLYRQGVVTGGRVQFGDTYHINNTYEAEARSNQYGQNGSQQHIYLPPRHSSPYFTGRALQLQQIQSSLARSLTDFYDHKIAVIYGIGGSGKTQFCLRYCEEHRER